MSPPRWAGELPALAPHSRAVPQPAVVSKTSAPKINTAMKLDFMPAWDRDPAGGVPHCFSSGRLKVLCPAFCISPSSATSLAASSFLSARKATSSFSNAASKSFIFIR